LKELFLDNYRIKDEIINFVQNSSEEVNSKVAIFIAGMQAQKSLMNCRQKEDEILFEKTEEEFDCIKIN
jgi:hypothetical protein